MAIITTYVCDVSGKSSQELSDFVTITVNGKHREKGHIYDTVMPGITKFVNKEVAAKLGFVCIPVQADAAAKAVIAEEVAKASFEGQLKALLHPWIMEIAQGVVDNQ